MQSWHESIPCEAEYDDAVIEDEDRLLLQQASTDTDRLVPLADQAAVEAECGKWAQLWCTDSPYTAEHLDHIDAEPLALLTVWAIRQACLSFPSGIEARR